MFRFNSYFMFALYINIFTVKSTCVLLTAFSLIKADLLPYTNGLHFYFQTLEFFFMVDFMNRHIIGEYNSGLLSLSHLTNLFSTNFNLNKS